MSTARVVAHDILELAEKNGAIPGKPEDYLLQGDKGQYGWDNWVDLEEDNVFLTIRNQRQAFSTTASLGGIKW